MTRKDLLVAAVLLAGVVLAARGDGAGGMFLGYTVGAHPLAARSGLPANIGELTYFGGWGWGASRGGALSGGFGLAILDASDTSGIAGGMGGFISGFRLLRFPIHLALVSWSGLGGLYAGRVGANAGQGYFVGFEEVDLELGLALASWFMPMVYVGYQATANLIPGLPLRENVTYAPVAGVRLAWGGFR